VWIKASFEKHNLLFHIVEEDNTETSPATLFASLWKYIAGSTFIASLCCLPSVVLVMLGLATVSTGAALSDTLYWGGDGFGWFRTTMLLIASLSVIVGLVVYFRTQGICTLDEAKSNRRKIINTSILVLSVAYLLYLLFNYVILTELGIALGIPWQESREAYQFWK
jgi:hypothetical protein